MYANSFYFYAFFFSLSFSFHELFENASWSYEKTLLWDICSVRLRLSWFDTIWYWICILGPCRFQQVDEGVRLWAHTQSLIEMFTTIEVAIKECANILMAKVRWPFWVSTDVLTVWCPRWKPFFIPTDVLAVWRSRWGNLFLYRQMF